MFAAVLVAVLVTLALTWIYNEFYVVNRLWATREVPEPPVPSTQWLLGHIPQLLARPMASFRCFHEWAKEYGPIYRVRFLWRPVIVVTDPELFQPLLRPGPAKLHKYTAPYKMFEVFVKPPQPNIVSSPENATWKAVRRAAVAALTMNNLRLCFPHITAVTQRLINSLAAAGPEAVQDIDLAAGQVTVDVIGLAAFGKDLQATCRTAQSLDSMTTHAGQQLTNSSNSTKIVGRGPEVLVVIKHLTVAMQARATNPLNRWFPWRQAYHDLMYWGGRMSDLVVDLLTDMESNPPPPYTLGAHLMACKYPTGEPLERNQLLAELGLMWGAGFETTAHTITWTLLLVSTHPAVEAAVTAELAALDLLATPQQPQPGQLKWEHLAQLKYLTAVINESMRLFPVVSSGTIRITHKPITLAGYHLPKGQPILIPFYSIHRSPALWEDPDAFKPERWLDAAAQPTAQAQAPATAAVVLTAAGDSQTPSDAVIASVPNEAVQSSDVTEAAAAPAAVAAAPAGPAKTASRPASPLSDDEYVDIGLDVYPRSDQQQKQQQQDKQQIVAGHKQAAPDGCTHSKSSNSPGTSKSSSNGLELKDPTLSKRGFLPFSEGNRNCAGQALALVEVKAVLAMLLGHFHFTLSKDMGGYEGVERDARQTVTLRPERGCHMHVQPRIAVTK